MNADANRYIAVRTTADAMSYLVKTPVDPDSGFRTAICVCPGDDAAELASRIAAMENGTIESLPPNASILLTPGESGWQGFLLIGNQHVSAEGKSVFAVLHQLAAAAEAIQGSRSDVAMRRGQKAEAEASVQ